MERPVALACDLDIPHSSSRKTSRSLPTSTIRGLAGQRLPPSLRRSRPRRTAPGAVRRSRFRRRRVRPAACPGSGRRLGFLYGRRHDGAAAASTAFTRKARARRTAAGHGAHPTASAGTIADDDDLDYISRPSEDIAGAGRRAAAAPQIRQPPRPLGPGHPPGVVVLGGIGAFALSGHGPGGTPALVRANN